MKIMICNAILVHTTAYACKYIIPNNTFKLLAFEYFQNY